MTLTFAGRDSFESQGVRDKANKKTRKYGNNEM
jgi:hypothetical protein